MTSSAKLSREVIGNSVTSMTVRVLGVGIAFLSQIILSRMLGASQFGSYVIALGWAMVLVIPARLGLDNSVLRYATIYREQGRAEDFRGLVVLSLACMAASSLLIGSALLVAKGAGAGLLSPIGWVMLAGVILLVPFSAILGWFSSLVRTANHIFAAQFYEQALRPTLLILALGLLALVERRPDAGQAMLITSVAVGVAAVGIAVHARGAFPTMHHARASFEHRREWLSVSWVLFLLAAAQELLNQIDVILLGILGSATQAAHFAAAWRLASLVPFGLVAIVTVSGPLIASAHHRGEMTELARIATLNARFSTLFAIAMAVLLALLGRPALGLFGPGFADAYPALMVLLAGGLVNSFTGSVGYLLIMTGHQRGALVIMAFALGLSVVANILLIPRLGATGAAIASSLALATWNLVMAIYVRRRIGIDATAVGMPPRVAATEGLHAG